MYVQWIVTFYYNYFKSQTYLWYMINMWYPISWVLKKIETNGTKKLYSLENVEKQMAEKSQFKFT